MSWRLSGERLLPAWWVWPADTSWCSFFEPERRLAPDLWLGAAHWNVRGEAELVFVGWVGDGLAPDSLQQRLGSEVRWLAGSFRDRRVWSALRDGKEWFAWAWLDGYLIAGRHAWLVEDAIDTWIEKDADPLPAEPGVAVWRIPELRAQWISWWDSPYAAWWQRLLSPFGKGILHAGPDSSGACLRLSVKAAYFTEPGEWLRMLRAIPPAAPLVLAGPAKWLQPPGLPELPADAHAVGMWTDSPGPRLDWGLVILAPDDWDMEADLWPEPAGQWHMFPLYTVALGEGTAWLAEADGLFLLASRRPLLERLLETMLSGANLAADPQWLAKAGAELSQAVAWGRVQMEDWPLLYRLLRRKPPSTSPSFSGTWTFVAQRGGEGAIEVRFPEMPRRTGRRDGAASIAWRAYLPARVVAGPWVAAGRVLLQMDDYRLAAFDLDGQFQWALPLDGPIVGAVHEVWLERLQGPILVCNTRQHLLLLTPAGEHVAPSPFRLARTATASVQPIDFLDNGHPWFFVPGGNRVQVFDEFVREVAGWNETVLPGTIQWPVCHLQDATNDYLCILSADGTASVFNRLGAARFSVPLEGPPVGPPGGQVHRLSKRFVVPLRAGRIKVIGLDGRSFNLRLPKISRAGDIRFAFEDVAGDDRNDYIGLSGRMLVVAGYEGRRFGTFGNHTFAERPEWMGVWHLPKGEQKGIMACALPDGKLWLLDGTCALLVEAPLAGARAALLEMDGRTLLLACEGRELMAYHLPIAARRQDLRRTYQ